MNNLIDIRDEETLEQLRKLTLERLKVMPSDTEVAIGSLEYTKADLIKHVSKADDLGRRVMKIQLEFLQDLASGEIYKNDSSGIAPQA